MSLIKTKELEENQNVNNNFSEEELKDLRTIAEIISNIIIHDIEKQSMVTNKIALIQSFSRKSKNITWRLGNRVVAYTRVSSYEQATQIPALKSNVRLVSILRNEEVL